MKALDAFCGEGGTSTGLHRAGFEVVGVDKDPERRPTRPRCTVTGEAAHVVHITCDGRVWGVYVTRTDFALQPPAPTDLPEDVRAALTEWLQRGKT